MQVEVFGDQDEANQWKESQKNTVVSDESDRESEQQESEEIVVSKKRRHRKPSQIDPMEEKMNKVLEVHPLSILITIILTNGTKLKIKFQYRPPLKIITVTSSVEISGNITGNCAREVLCGESILNELTEKDYGTSSPNPSNQYDLQKVGLGSFESLVPKLGYAYIWAQKICGLDYLGSVVSKEETMDVSRMNVEIVIRTLYKRLKDRYSLSEQLQQIGMHSYIKELINIFNN